MKLILGSSSKYRKAILELEGYVFDVVDPDVDERAIQVENIRERSLVLARVKAEAVAKTLLRRGFAGQEVKEPAIIIASDQVIICDGKLYEKPEDIAEARKFLAHYNAGGVPESLTAVVVLDTETGEKFEGVDKAKIFFKPLPEEAIKKFIEKDEPLTRAGGFGIKDTALTPYVERVDGTEDSVTGLPMHLLKELLTKAGYNI